MVPIRECTIGLINDDTDGCVPMTARIEADRENIKIRILKQRITVNIRVEDIADAIFSAKKATDEERQ